MLYICINYHHNSYYVKFFNFICAMIFYYIHYKDGNVREVDSSEFQLCVNSCRCDIHKERIDDFSIGYHVDVDFAYDGK